jgi:hypothetical protein
MQGDEQEIRPRVKSEPMMRKSIARLVKQTHAGTR